MTCAKCGMSIDAQADERQETVRGRVKEKPEIEIDPSLPQTPSKFPLGLAIAIAVLVCGGVAFVAYSLRDKPGEITDEQRERAKTTAAMQKAFVELWDTMPEAHSVESCRMLFELVTRKCLPTVDPTLLAFDKALIAIGMKSPDCVSAVGAFSKSRFDAKCD